jgi:hypothetical protein
MTPFLRASERWRYAGQKPARSALSRRQRLFCGSHARTTRVTEETAPRRLRGHSSRECSPPLGNLVPSPIVKTFSCRRQGLMFGQAAAHSGPYSGITYFLPEHLTQSDAMAAHRDRQQVVLAPNGFFVSHERRPRLFSRSASVIAGRTVTILGRRIE